MHPRAAISSYFPPQPWRRTYVVDLTLVFIGCSYAGAERSLRWAGCGARRRLCVLEHNHDEDHHWPGAREALTPAASNTAAGPYRSCWIAESVRQFVDSVLTHPDRGATCYLNSLIQALCTLRSSMHLSYCLADMTPELRRGLYAISPEELGYTAEVVWPILSLRSVDGAQVAEKKPAAATATEPDEESICNLMSMGFERKNVIKALKKHPRSESRAIEFLLEGGRSWLLPFGEALTRTF
jgi:hypothetical protein